MPSLREFLDLSQVKQRHKPCSSTVWRTAGLQAHRSPLTDRQTDGEREGERERKFVSLPSVIIPVESSKDKIYILSASFPLFLLIYNENLLHKLTYKGKQSLGYQHYIQRIPKSV